MTDSRQHPPRHPWSRAVTEPDERWAEVKESGFTIYARDTHGVGILSGRQPIDLPDPLTRRQAMRAGRRAARCHALAEATQMLVDDLLGGVPVHRVTTPRGRAEAEEAPRGAQPGWVGVCFAYGDGRCAVTVVNDERHLSWVPGPLPGWTAGGRERRLLQRHRMWLLTQTLYNFTNSEFAASRVIAEDGGITASLHKQAAVLHWWDDRIEAGYTPEAAQVMFALTIHPATQRHFTWSPDGHPRSTLPSTRAVGDEEDLQP